MTPIVKRFIEKEKSLVEKGDWKYFFVLWNSFGDDAHFEELLDVFRLAGIPIDTYLEQVRPAILHELFDSMIYLRSHKNVLSFDRFFNGIGPHLGASEDELKKVFNEVAEQYDFEYAGDDLWYKKE